MQLEKLFLKGWRHPQKGKPALRAIFKILSSDASIEQYTTYRSQVHAFNVLTGFKKGANEQLRFHGTRRLCSLGEDSSKVFLCSLPGCSLCCIIRNSFDVGKCGSTHSFRRFGEGIYTTSCSSKADDYFSGRTGHCSLRVLLVNRVVVGRPHNRRHNNTSMKAPPRGYHSVIGLPGVDLNYEESVVYRNESIRPAYLLVYGQKPEQKTHSKAHAMLSALFKTPVAV